MHGNLPGKKSIVMFLMVLIGICIVFSYGIGNVSAVSTSKIYINSTTGNDAWNGQSAIWDGTNGPKRSIKGGVSAVSDGGTVEIDNGKYTGIDNVKISINKNMNIKGLTNGGTTINGTNSGSIFTVGAGVSVNMLNLIIVNGKGPSKGAIINGGTLTMTNCTFKQNKAPDRGGAIYNSQTLSLAKCTFESNSASNYGGAVYNEGKLNIYGTIFKYNKASAADSAGGSIFINTGTVIINKSQFTGNTADNGGALVTGGTTTITNSIFTSNSATASKGIGGAIDNIGTLTVTDSNFTSNNANGDGGALNNLGTASGGSMTLTGCNFKNNMASVRGGAVDNGQHLKISKCSFTSNTALNGGAFHNTNEYAITISNCVFKNNNATEAGGAIMSSSEVTAPLTVTNSSFSGNTAFNGAAIFNYDGLNLKYDNFTSNKAANRGGVVNNEGTLKMTSCNLINNNADNGGAVFNWGDNAVLYFNRIVGNTATQGSAIFNENGPVDASYNWWGTNSNPASKLYGVTVTKWLIMKISAVPTSIHNSGLSTIKVDLTYDNTGIHHTGGYIMDGTPVIYTKTLGTLQTYKGKTTNGISTSILNGGLVAGTSIVSATVDGQTLKTSVVIRDTIPPKVVSTIPTNGVTNFSRLATITIKFSEKIKTSICWSKIKVLDKNGNSVSISKSITNNTLSIKTTQIRMANSWYKVIIPKMAVKDYANNKSDKDCTFQFKTKA